MRTQIKKSGDTVIVNVNGKLDYETQEPFKQDLKNLITDAKTDSVPHKIIINMEKLEFVGSSGISNFIQTLKDFNARSESKPRYCGVRSEFKRIIKAFDEDSAFDIYDTEDRARKSFENN